MHADFGGAHRVASRRPGRAEGKAGDQYSVDHSVLLYVINPDGRLHAQIAPPFDPAGVAGRIGRFAQAYLATKAAVTAASQQGVR
jgi:cytochrome oxidase Cu insertion factor (SCO1/SenC/PrrC family)